MTYRQVCWDLRTPTTPRANLQQQQCCGETQASVNTINVSQAERDASVANIQQVYQELKKKLLLLCCCVVMLWCCEVGWCCWFWSRETGLLSLHTLHILDQSTLLLLTLPRLHCSGLFQHISRFDNPDRSTSMSSWKYEMDWITREYSSGKVYLRYNL